MNKKSIMMSLALLATMSATTVNASNYQVIYGEKQISGDNIRFVKKAPPPVEPPAPVEECNVPNSVWTAGSPAYALLMITWNGQYITDSGEWEATEKVFGGYKYTRGVITAQMGYSSTWTVCRIKL